MSPVELRALHPGLKSQLGSVRLKHRLVTVVVNVARLKASRVVQISPGAHSSSISERVHSLSVSPVHAAHVKFSRWESPNVKTNGIRNKLWKATY